MTSDIETFEAMQREQGLEKVYGLDNVVQWLPWADAARMGVVELYGAKFALLDPNTYSEFDELKGGTQLDLEREFQAAYLAIEQAGSYEAYIALDYDIWGGDFVPAILIGHDEAAGGL